MDGLTNKGGTRGDSRGADNGSNNDEQSNKEGQGIDQKIKKAPLPHDEAFKKLLQIFFAEFMAQNQN